MNDISSLSHTAYEVELQIPYSICAKVSDKGVLWRKESRGRRDFTATLRMEGGTDSTGRSMPGSCAYAHRNTAKGGSIKFHGISQGKEQPDDLREVSGIEVQVPEPRILMQRVLCRYSREERTAYSRIHKETVRGG